MEDARIKAYVDTLVECWALDETDDNERVVRQTLHDLLMAVSRFEVMNDGQKALTMALCKKLQEHFDTKFSIKERKETKKKKNFPPNPLLKEKEKKETEEKHTEQNTAAGDAVLDCFRKECLRYVEQYGRELVDDFYYHWKQVDKETGKRLFEEKRCFDIDSQLRAWSKSEFTLSKETAAERLKKQKKQQAVAQKQGVVNDDLWEHSVQMKQGAVTHEEWLAMKEKEHESHE